MLSVCSNNMCVAPTTPTSPVLEETQCLITLNRPIAIVNSRYSLFQYNRELMLRPWPHHRSCDLINPIAPISDRTKPIDFVLPFPTYTPRAAGLCMLTGCEVVITLDNQSSNHGRPAWPSAHCYSTVTSGQTRVVQQAGKSLHYLSPSIIYDAKSNLAI